jgi:hypothetical protein
MKEVNRILTLANGDSKIAIADPIECEFSLEEQNGLDSLMKKYSGTLNFNSCCGKKEEDSSIKAEEE